MRHASAVRDGDSAVPASSGTRITVAVGSICTVGGAEHRIVAQRRQYLWCAADRRRSALRCRGGIPRRRAADLPGTTRPGSMPVEGSAVAATLGRPASVAAGSAGRVCRATAACGCGGGGRSARAQVAVLAVSGLGWVRVGACGADGSVRPGGVAVAGLGEGVGAKRCEQRLAGWWLGLRPSVAVAAELRRLHHGPGRRSRPCCRAASRARTVPGATTNSACPAPPLMLTTLRGTPRAAPIVTSPVN